MDNIDYTEYDRITDTLMYLNDDVSLNFSVALSRKGRSGDRIFYHYESEFGSDKYGGKLRSIKRIMKFYFVIDCKSDFNAGFILRPEDVEILSRILNLKVLPWYFGTTNEAAFQIVTNNLVLTNFQPETFVQATIYDSKAITFEPIVMVENEMETRGVRMSLSTGPVINMTIDKFMGFYHILTTTDMCTLAATMCNYVKIPPYGINTYTTQGLGAKPPASVSGWNSNAFLDGSKSKREE